MTVNVALRLGMQGGKEVARTFDDTGRAGKKAMKDIRDEAQGLPPHLVAVSRSVGLAKDKVDDLVASTGALGKISGSFGMWGSAIALGVTAAAAGAVALFNAAKGAIAYGDAIADAATNAGVSTDTLQELRYAVHQTGGEYEDADKAVSDFTKKLGAAESGNQKALKGFKQLGFSQEDLKSFASADDALHAVMDRISQLGKESERQYIAEKLGLAPMIPLLREGSEKMDELRRAAHDLGYVMDADLVAAAGDANDKLEDLQQVVKVQLNSALIEAAPLILSVAGAMAEGSKKARSFADDLRNAGTNIQAFLNRHSLLKKGVELEGKVLWNITPFPWIGRAVKALGGNKDWQSLESPDRSFEIEGDDPAAGNGSLRDYGADAAASSAASKAKAAAAAAKREADRLEKVAEKAGKDIADRWEGAAQAASNYAAATELSAAKLSENASEVDRLERIKGYYADINELTRAGLDILQAKALVQARILAEAQAEAHARSNPEDFVSSADRVAQATDGAVLSRPGYDFTWLREGAGQAFYEGLAGASEGGDFFETFERRLEQAVVSAFANKATDALFGKQGGGGGGLWDAIGKFAGSVAGNLGSGGSSSIHSSVNKAGRALGGPVYRGDVRSINEQGLELMAASSDGSVFNAERIARAAGDAAMAARSAYRETGGGGSGGPIAVNLVNNSGAPLRATATETRAPDGSRGLDVMLDLIDQRADQRVREQFAGRDDAAFGARFGVRPRLSGG